MRTYLTALLNGVLLIVATGYVVHHRCPQNPAATQELVQMMRRQDERLETLSQSLAAGRHLNAGVAPATAQTGCDANTLVAEVAKLFEERSRSTDSRDEHQADRDDPTRLSAESIAAEEAGRRLLAAALSSRRWGTGEAAQMNKLIPAMTVVQYEQLMQAISTAINRGELIPDNPVLLF